MASDPRGPLDHLPRLGRDEAATLVGWARAMGWASIRAAGRDAAAWLGAPLQLTVGLASTPPDDADASPAAVIERDGVRAGLTLDSTLAAALLDRALGGDGAEVEPVAGLLTELERGALAYGLARWLAPTGWRVGAVFGHPAAMREAIGAAPALRWPAEASLGPATGTIAWWLPKGAPPAAPRTIPRWTGALTVTARLEVGRAVLPAKDIAALEAGDAVIPDTCSVDLDGEGDATLRTAGRALAVTRTPRGWSVREVRREREPRRSDVGDEKDPSLEGMADTPITLTVELARFELTLADVAALTPGEVVEVGGTGAEVRLMAGERPIANGELVLVEGELAVRVRDVFRGREG